MVESQDVVKGQAFVTGMLTLSSVVASIMGGTLIRGDETFPALLVGEIMTVIGLLIVAFSVERNQNCRRVDSDS